jgi:hypothetical protein
VCTTARLRGPPGIGEQYRQLGAQFVMLTGIRRWQLEGTAEEPDRDDRIARGGSRTARRSHAAPPRLVGGAERELFATRGRRAGGQASPSLEMKTGAHVLGEFS